ncbi:hypothetical protein D8Z77_14875 [Brevibacillus laterosporus]|nr:hypothetical protein D8Z77_14875 [Brevibacillus laterosporus]
MNERGEILEERRLLLRSNEIVKVINPYTTGGRNTKFVKSKTSQKAKRRFYHSTWKKRGFSPRFCVILHQDAPLSRRWRAWDERKVAYNYAAIPNLSPKQAERV